MNAGNNLNSILSRWLLHEPTVVPPVDCGACSMAATDPANAARWSLFKCCAFQPFFPNFSLGALLVASPRELWSDQVYLGPLGLMAVKEFRDGCEQTPDELRGPEHLCTFYDAKERRCGVWEFRPGECSSYYCQTSPVNQRLSERTFAVESAVAQMAMVELGFSPAQIAAEVETLNSGVTTAVWDPALLLDVYRRAFEWSEGLKPEQIQQWLDFDILGKVRP